MKKKQRPVRKVIIYALVIIISIYSFFPIYWMFISSCRAYKELFSSVSLIPGPFSLKSYINLLSMTKYLINFKNSLWVAFFHNRNYINLFHIDGLCDHAISVEG